MRILLDQAVYTQRNKGNVALLQTALWRIHKLWPEASLEVITQSPHILRLYCPDAFPVSVYNHHNWSKNREKFERLHRVMPGSILRVLLEIREELQYRNLNPQQLRQRLKTSLGKGDESQDGAEHLMSNSGNGSYDSNDVEQAIQGADMVIGTGGGYMADVVWEDARPVLLRLATAKRMGKFTAMVGQGIGPIEIPEFRALASSILPEVDLILVRESRVAIPLLESIGVPPERVCMTGDDAVEMAYEARRPTLGSDIGISVRFASYTQIEQMDVNRIRAVLHQASAKYGAFLRGIPMRSATGLEQDQFLIAKLLAGYPKSVQSWYRLEPPIEHIRKVGRCRVVVTGTFHGAVFALSQGIPAIGLIRSKEYLIKFSGLVDQFGPGCQFLYMDDEQLPEKLAAAIDKAWESADRLRPQLLEAAAAQIHLNRKGYQHLYDLYQLHSQSARK